jgi:hypothetical protein
LAVYTASGYAALLRAYPYQKTFLGVSNSRVKTTGIRRIGLANSQTTPDDDVMWKTILLFFLFLANMALLLQVLRSFTRISAPRAASAKL